MLARTVCTAFLLATLTGATASPVVADDQPNKQGHWRSKQNPSFCPLVEFVESGGDGTASFVLQPDADASLKDVEKFFGHWNRTQEGCSMSSNVPATGYLYNRRKGWIAFECEKKKTSKLLEIQLTDK